jgi:hypothetical protein
MPGILVGVLEGGIHCVQANQMKRDEGRIGKETSINYRRLGERAIPWLKL